MKPNIQSFNTRSGQWLLAIAGCSGFLIGLAHWRWQQAAENAQIIAGIVSYTSSSPVAIAQAKYWSLLSQIGAVLLSLGVSELALTKILSGLLGLLSFQALAVIVYALSRNSILSIGSVFIIFVSGVTDYGAVYPLRLLGGPVTYGWAGLSFAVLAIGLLSMGWYRSGAFLLGVAPAVHMPVGVWAILIAGLALLPAYREMRAPIRIGSRFFGAGAIVALLSFVAHRAMAPSIAGIDPATAARYLHAFVPYWDGHRQPVPLNSPGVMLCACATAFALLWLIRFRSSLPSNVKLLLRFVAIGGALSLSLAWWSTLPAAWIPDWFLVVFPGRMLNFNVMLAPALLLGLTSTLGPPILSETMILALAVGLLISRQSELLRFIDWAPTMNNLVVMASGFACAIVAAFLAPDDRQKTAAWRSGFSPSGPTFPSRAQVILRTAFLIVIGVAAGVGFFRAEKDMVQNNQLERQSEPVFQAAARADGLLLTGADLWLVQLRTRRPILLDGRGLDSLPYAPEAFPAADRILRDVYGIDLFNPPEEARDWGRVPHNANRGVWEARTRVQWQRIGQEYGVSQVLTPNGWNLDLPIIAHSPDLTLYVVPR